MTKSTNALIPSNTLQFYGHDLLLLEINSKQCVAMKPICEAIGLDWVSQLKRVKRDDVLNSAMVITTIVAEDGKEREMVCLPIDYLNGWLFGIATSRVNPTLRDAITLYKRECYQVLHDYWNKGQATHPNFLAEATREVHKLGLSKEQQDQIKALHKELVSAVPKEKQAKLAISLWSGVKAKFGVSYKDVPPDSFVDVISLMSRIALEGEHIPADKVEEDTPAYTHEMHELQSYLGDFNTGTYLTIETARGCIKQLETLLFNLTAMQSMSKTLRNDIRKQK